LTSWLSFNNPVFNQEDRQGGVKRLDRYFLTRLLGPFGFFALVLTGIIWLTQALGLIDRVIAYNQSALVFLEFSSLILPRVLNIVLPMAAFAAALFSAHRLYMESELIVAMAAGRSQLALAWPFLAFGMLVMALMLLLSLYLVPYSTARLADRLNAFRSEVGNAFVAEGEFVHPVEGVTLFVKETSRDGEMSGLFLNDQREPLNTVTYWAQRAVLITDESKTQLVMFDGVAQSHANGEPALTSVKFAQFAFDLSDLAAERATRQRTPREYFIADLLRPNAAMLASKRYSAGDYIAEGHNQLALPLLALAFPALALAGVLAGPFRRSGMGGRLFLTVAGATALMVLATLAKNLVVRSPELVWISYLAPVLAGVAALVLLLRGSRATEVKIGRKP
jgi:lipopolysaccharide export system permease protein